MLLAAPALAQAPGTNGGPTIAYTVDLVPAPPLPTPELENSFSGQIWALQGNPSDVSSLSQDPFGVTTREGAYSGPHGVDPCSCVSYVKHKRRDQTEPWGAPKYVQAYDIEPFAGLIVVTTESRPGTDTGHAAYIEEVTETSLIVSEANFAACEVTTRTIPRDAEYIRGFR